MSPRLNARERILDVTWELYNKLSPKSPTIAEVAEAAGVSRQAVYLHFANRARLLTETIQSRQVDVPDRLERSRSVAPDQIFTSWLSEIFDEYERILPVGRAFVAAVYLDPDGAAAWEDRVEAIRGSARRAVEKLVEHGVLRSNWTVDTAADWVYSKMNFVAWHLLVYELGWSQQMTLEKTVASLESDLLDLG